MTSEQDTDSCQCGDVPFRHLDDDGHLPRCEENRARREVLFTAAELLREIPARGLLTAIFVASDNPDAREEARDLLREHLGVVDLLDWQRSHTTAEADAMSTASGLFECGACHRRVPWSKGSDDEMPDACDDCWAAANLGVERPAGTGGER